MSTRQRVYGGFLILSILLLPSPPLSSYAKNGDSRTNRWGIYNWGPEQGTVGKDCVTPHVPSPVLQTIKRASPSHVGSIMAILATLESSHVLPPENSPQASQIIQALIQFQSAFMKSSHPAVMQFLEEACKQKFGSNSAAVISKLRRQGWTSKTLEAVVDYDSTHVVWTPFLEEGLSPYNMRKEDFKLLAHIYIQARTSFAQRSQDIHQVYTQWRGQMPGGR